MNENERCAISRTYLSCTRWPISPVESYERLKKKKKKKNERKEKKLKNGNRKKKKKASPPKFFFNPVVLYRLTCCASRARTTLPSPCRAAGRAFEQGVHFALLTSMAHSRVPPQRLVNQHGSLEGTATTPCQPAWLTRGYQRSKTEK